MGIPGAANPLLLASASGYQIERSLRFNSADSAYLIRTPASAGNRKTWTWAGWVKRSKLASDFGVQFIFSGRSADSNRTAFAFIDDGSLRVYFNHTSGWMGTSVEKFRDFSAWFHVVVQVDTTNATASDRIKVWANNSRLTLSTSSGSLPTLNTDGGVNNTIAHTIGDDAPPQGYYFSGYLAEIHFIDGQALTPSSFGETDGNGVWQPKAYTGSYGTNGFHLPFSDNSTAAALGTDTSGNGNTWTVNNLGVFPPGTGGYSPSTSVLAYGSSPYNVLDMFDGSLSTFAYTRYTENITRFTPPAAISYSSSVEIYVFRGNGTVPDNATTVTSYIFNGGSNTIFQGSNTPGWVTVATGSGSLNYIEYRSFKSIGFQATSDWYAIRVDGVILVDNSLSANNDSLVDTPTSYGTDTGIGGEVRGNYATFNPLSRLYSGTASFLNGNLEVVETSSAARSFVSTIAISAGKFYWEITKTAGVTSDNAVGVLPASQTALTNVYDGSSIYYRGTGQRVQTGTTQTAGAASWGVNDVIGVALNMDAGEISFYKNGVLQVGVITGVSTSTAWLPYCGDDVSATNTSWLANFGQRPFAYTAPSGFKALCTQNLPEGTITTSGTFTGNANADGPFVYLNGVPTAMTINGNAVTFATHADKLSNGFKLRTNSGSYNTSGSNTYSVSTTGSKFKYARAQPNP